MPNFQTNYVSPTRRIYDYKHGSKRVLVNIISGKMMVGPNNVHFGIIHFRNAAALFVVLQQFNHLFDERPEDNDAFMAHTRQVFLGQALLEMDAVVEQLLLNVPAIMLDNLLRLQMLSKLLLGVKSLWDLEQQQITIVHLPQITELAIYFEEIHFVDEAISHWPLFVAAVRDMAELLTENPVGFNIKNLSLDILEGLKHQLRHNSSPSNQQVIRLLQILAGGGNYVFLGPYGPRALYFEPRNQDLNIRRFPGINMPPRH